MPLWTCAAGAAPRRTLSVLCRPVRTLLLIAGTAAFCAGAVDADELLAQTLDLRTALHNDPSLDVPLDRLVAAWRDAGQVPALVATYRDHLGSYPDDRNAAAVLVRILLATGDDEVTKASSIAIELHKDDAYLRWLHARALMAAKDPRGLDELARAVELAPDERRREAWSDQLVAAALKAGRKDLAEQVLKQAGDLSRGPAALLALGRKQAAAGLHAEALKTLNAAAAWRDCPPELLVEIDLAIAEREAALGRGEAAAAKLDALLSRLDADHWRRGDVLQQRLSLAATPEDRERLIAAARARLTAAPGDEAAALDAARILAACEQPRQAAELLLSLSKTGVSSPRLERELAVLLERIGDLDRLDAWLAEREAAEPGRVDLAWWRARIQFERSATGQARETAEAAAAKLPPAERHDRLVALARQLRPAGRHGDAAWLLERAAAALPDRLDTRRELAESCIAAGDPARAEDLFTGDPPAGALPEQVLDAVQFLVAQRRYAGAARWCALRLRSDPGHFELRVLALKIAGRLGDGGRAQIESTQTRALADTPSRYRLWLDASLDAVGREGGTAFITAECERLGKSLAQGLSPADAQRIAAAAEAASRFEADTAGLDLLRRALRSEPPAEIALPLRRRLVSLLSETPRTDPTALHSDAKAREKELREQLTRLASEDLERSEDVAARLILLPSEAKPEDPNRMPDPDDERSVALATRLARLDLSKLREANLVTKVVDAFAAAGDFAHAAEASARLAALEPATRSHWQRWLDLLAESGDEDALRAGLRRFLVGVPEQRPAADIQARLRIAVLDSCWRSIIPLLARGTARDVVEAEALLGTAQASALPLRRMEKIALDSGAAPSLFAPAAPTAGEMLDPAEIGREAETWIAFTRALIHARQGRVGARDAALRDLTSLVAASAASAASKAEPLAVLHGSAHGPAPAHPAPQPASAAVSSARIAFPDGLAIELAQAQRLLLNLGVAATPPPADARHAGLPPWSNHWAADTGAPIVGLWFSDGLVLTAAGGDLLAFDAATGKRRWREALSTAFAIVGDSLVDTDATGLRCRALRDRSLRWRSTLVRDVSALVALHGASATAADVIAVSSDGRTCLRLSGAEGRLRWSTALPRIGKSSAGFNPYAHLNANAQAKNTATCHITVSPDCIAIAGGHGGILAADTGAVRWSFDASAVRPEVPRLETKKPTMPVVPSGRHGYGGYSHRGRYGGGRHGWPTMVTSQASSAQQPTPPSSLIARIVQATAPDYDEGYIPSLFSVIPLGDRLLLGDDQGSAVTSLNLPIGQRDLPRGALVGSWRSKALLLDRRQAHLVDLRSGAVQGLDLSAVLPVRDRSVVLSELFRIGEEDEDEGDEDASSRGSRGDKERLDAVLDGRLAWIAGPRGVIGVDLDRAETVISCPWPAGTLPTQTKPIAQPAASMNDHDFRRGYARTFTPTAFDVTLTSIDGIPPLGVVGPGLLVLPVSATRLVACLGGVDGPIPTTLVPAAPPAKPAGPATRAGTAPAPAPVKPAPQRQDPPDTIP